MTFTLRTLSKTRTSKLRTGTSHQDVVGKMQARCRQDVQDQIPSATYFIHMQMPSVTRIWRKAKYASNRCGPTANRYMLFVRRTVYASICVNLSEPLCMCLRTSNDVCEPAHTNWRAGQILAPDLKNFVYEMAHKIRLQISTHHLLGIHTQSSIFKQPQ